MRYVQMFSMIVAIAVALACDNGSRRRAYIMRYGKTAWTLGNL